MSLHASANHWILQPRFDPQIREPKPAQITYETLQCPVCKRLYLYRMPGDFSFCRGCKTALELPD